MRRRPPESTTALPAHSFRVGLLLCLLLALAPSAASAADPVSGGQARLGLGPDLTASLRQAGVRLSARGPARLKGRQLSLPVSGGALTAGSGRLLVAGGLRLAASGRSASLGHLVLDTKSGALLAELGGRRLRLAIARRPRVRRDDFGFDATLGKLVLTGNGARRLDRSLGLGDLVRAGDVLGTATAGARLARVTVTYGTAFLTLDEAFVGKLRSLEVSGAPFGSGWYYSKTPLAFAFTELHGTAALDLSAGGVESADGLRLTQAGGEGLNEVALLGIALDFASKSIAAEIKAQPSGAGEATVFATLQIPVFHKNAFTGVISTADTDATVSPYLAGLLNQTFAESRHLPPVFAAGEPLGRLAFMAGTHGKPR